MALTQLIGLALAVVGAISFIALLIQDLVRSGSPGTVAEGGVDWIAILGKLPARYLPSVIAIVLGLAMYDPGTFGSFLSRAPLKG
jgi:hypothetical protein